MLPGLHDDKLHTWFVRLLVCVRQSWCGWDAASESMLCASGA